VHPIQALSGLVLIGSETEESVHGANALPAASTDPEVPIAPDGATRRKGDIPTLGR
jgi:hypothetical protein